MFFDIAYVTVPVVVKVTIEYHVTIGLILQLISGISRVLQKLLKKFKGYTSISQLLALLVVMQLTSYLKLNDPDTVMLFFGLSLQYF